MIARMAIAAVLAGLTGMLMAQQGGPGPVRLLGPPVREAPPPPAELDEGVEPGRLDGRASSWPQAATADAVLLGTVESVKMTGQTRSMPPTTFYQVTFADAEMLKGARPVALTFDYSDRMGRGLTPVKGQKYIALLSAHTRTGGIQVPPGERMVISAISELLAADDASVAAVRQALGGAGLRTERQKLIEAVTGGQLVFVGKLSKAVAGPVAMSEPPQASFTLGFEDVQALRGAKPDADAAFAYTYIRGRNTEPQVGQRFIVVATAGPVPAGRAQPGAIQPMPGIIEIPPGRRLVPIVPPVEVEPAPLPGGDEIPRPPLPPLQMDGPIQPMQLQVQPRPVRPALPLPGGGGSAGRVTALFEATEANVALARRLAGLPVGWSVDEAGEPLSPWAGLGEKAWPGAAKVPPDVQTRCARSGRPALAAGPGVTLAVEQVIPEKVEKFKNPFGDGKFTVTVANTTDKPLDVAALLTDGRTIYWADCLVVIERKTPRLPPGAGSLPADVRPVRLEPGESVSTVVDTLKLEGVSWPRGGSRVHFHFALGELSAESFFYYYSDFHDRLRGVQAAKPAQPAPPVQVGWIKLFADEPWYKDHHGAEQEFTGRLVAIPDPAHVVASALQRTSYYMLGDRAVYTAARKLPALDGLVGKMVVIRGKPYDIALEGGQVREIWPAAVRMAPAGPVAPGPSTLDPKDAEPIRPFERIDPIKPGPVPR